jgi:hypothetical protein
MTLSLVSSIVMAILKMRTAFGRVLLGITAFHLAGCVSTPTQLQRTETATYQGLKVCAFPSGEGHPELEPALVDMVRQYHKDYPVSATESLAAAAAQGCDVALRVFRPRKLSDWSGKADVISVRSGEQLLHVEAKGAMENVASTLKVSAMQQFAPGTDLYARLLAERRSPAQAPASAGPPQVLTKEDVRRMMEEVVKGAQAHDGAAAATPAIQKQIRPDFASPQAENDYAVVIGVENYTDLPAATYAERDAAAAKSFILALGVPERNIVSLTGTRATKTSFEKTIEDWLPNNVSENSRVYFFYSGHGAPDAQTGAAYLLPSDGDPQYLARTGYPLKRLYAQLGQLKARSVLVALDSCFSGAGGRSVLAKGTRPLVSKVDIEVQAQGKVSVISASAGDQISGTNDEAGYGLFTYNFLQGLNGAAKDEQGRVTLKSLYGFIKPRVQDDARRVNRDQTPQLQIGGDDLILRAK